MSIVNQENSRTSENCFLSPLAAELRRKYYRDYYKRLTGKRKKYGSGQDRNTRYWERLAEKALQEYRDGAPLDNETLAIIRALDESGPEVRA